MLTLSKLVCNLNFNHKQSKHKVANVHIIEPSLRMLAVKNLLTQRLRSYYTPLVGN